MLSSIGMSMLSLTSSYSREVRRRLTGGDPSEEGGTSLGSRFRCCEAEDTELEATELERSYVVRSDMIPLASRYSVKHDC